MGKENRDWYRSEHPPTCTCVDCTEERLAQRRQPPTKTKEEKAKATDLIRTESTSIKTSDKSKYPVLYQVKQSHKKNRITRILGWFVFTVAITGFITNLWFYTPIMDNLYPWSINTGMCICLGFISWGFAHYNVVAVWPRYFKPSLKSLLTVGCIATVAYTSYSLVRELDTIPFEGNIALFVVAIVTLILLGWITRHKVATTLLSLAFASGVILTILRSQGMRIETPTLEFPEWLRVWATWIGLLGFLNPLYFLIGVAIIVWIVITIKRG